MRVWGFYLTGLDVHPTNHEVFFIKQQVTLGLAVTYKQCCQGMVGRSRATGFQVFCDKLLYEKGVFLTPGGIFGSEGDRYMRLSLCAPQSLLVQVLNKVKI